MSKLLVIHFRRHLQVAANRRHTVKTLLHGARRQAVLACSCLQKLLLRYCNERVGTGHPRKEPS